MNAPPDLERAAIRRAYNAWRAGAELRDEDVERLAIAAGLSLSRTRLRNLGRYDGRGVSIGAEELAAIISAWAREIQNARETS